MHDTSFLLQALAVPIQVFLAGGWKRHLDSGSTLKGPFFSCITALRNTPVYFSNLIPVENVEMKLRVNSLFIYICNRNSIITCIVYVNTIQHAHHMCISLINLYTQMILSCSACQPTSRVTRRPAHVLARSPKVFETLVVVESAESPRTQTIPRQCSANDKTEMDVPFLLRHAFSHAHRLEWYNECSTHDA